MQIVIPGLTRNPVFSWIPAFAGMTRDVAIYDAVHRMFRAVLSGIFWAEIASANPGAWRRKLQKSSFGWIFCLTNSKMWNIHKGVFREGVGNRELWISTEYVIPVQTGIQEVVENTGFPLPDQVEDKLRGNDKGTRIS